MKKFMLLSLLFSMVISCAIPPVERWAKSGIGQHISSIEIHDKSETSYASKINWTKPPYNKDGKNFYVTPIRKNCFVHFEYNENGIITGFELEGDNCY